MAAGDRPSPTETCRAGRYIRNRRLYDAIDSWAFCALNTSPGCRDFYDHRRNVGDLHHQALRALGNRLVGILHGCLRHRVVYDEHTAWATETNKTKINKPPLDKLQPCDV